MQQYSNCINSGFSWLEGPHPITVSLQFDKDSLLTFGMKLTKNISSHKTI